jgi:hypothetical protein
MNAKQFVQNRVDAISIPEIFRTAHAVGFYCGMTVACFPGKAGIAGSTG